MPTRALLVVGLLALLGAVMVAGAPPVTKKIVTATDAGKMQDIKLATTGKASSQKLQDAQQALDEEAPAEDEAAAEEAPAEDGAEDDAADADADADADDDKDGDDEPDGVADDDEQAAKMGFWKKIIGGDPSGGMGMGNGDHHPPKDIPALVWALPIVGLVGVGIAIAAYCSFGT